MEHMTGRERIMTALRNKQPDRIPATPDISVMIPCLLTGKPFWDIGVNSNPSGTSAYINAARHFGIDGWLFNGNLSYKRKSEISEENKIEKYENRWIVHTTIHTPDGDLNSVSMYPRDNPGSNIEKPVKDFKEDFKKIKHLYSDVISYDSTMYKQQKKEMGETGMICCYIDPPGLQNYCHLMGLQELTYAYYDYPELFEELVSMHEKADIQKMEMAIDAGVESILTGGSGSITLQSPELFRKLSLPTIKKLTGMCREAGIISGVHSCGKERAVIEACANETDLNYINPLEIPPMGDCSLADAKKDFGNKLALMGNLHTTDIMLQGSVKDVRRESLKAIRDAGMNGGFVLSTGDQCGRDTPFENIFEMVNVVKEFGRYPLDMDRINCEILKLERDL